MSRAVTDLVARKKRGEKGEQIISNLTIPVQFSPPQPDKRVSMGLTVNRQMGRKLTVNRQKRNIFTVNRQMSEPKLAVKFLRYP